MRTTTRLAIERARLLRSTNGQPFPTVTLAGALSAIAKSGKHPIAVEAYWDGDTEGWFVRLAADFGPAPGDGGKRLEVELGLLARGGDIRLFNGAVPPWPEAVEAMSLGAAIADQLAVPFYFPSPDRPALDCPRWHERHLATACATCGIPVLRRIGTDTLGRCESCHLAAGHSTARQSSVPVTPYTAREPTRGVDIVVPVPAGMDPNGAVEAYIGKHPELSRCSLLISARWMDDRHDSLILRVPFFSIASECAITASAVSVPSQSGSVDVHFTISFDGFSHAGKVTHVPEGALVSHAHWSSVDEATLKLMEDLDPSEWSDFLDTIMSVAVRARELSG